MKTSPSSIAREITCPGSVLLPHSDSVSPPALRGTALHAYLCAVANGMGRDIAKLMLPEEWQIDAEAIDLDQLPPLNPATGVPEIAIAWNIDTGEVRELARGGLLSREEIRAKARDGEFVGILDWLALTSDGGVVRDYKSGWSVVDRAEVNWQLACCAVLAAKLLKLDRVHVGITRLLRNGDAYHDVATLDALDLDDAEARIRAHIFHVREIEDTYRAKGVLPKLIESAHCRWCPAFKMCPAKVALAKAILSDDGKLPSLFAELPVPLSDADAAQLWPKLKQAADLVEKLQGTIKEIADRTPLTLPNGNVLGPVECTTRTLIPDRLKAYVDPGFYAAVAKTTTKVTGTAVEEFLKSTKGKEEKLAPILRAFYADAEKNGAVKTSTYQRVEEVKPSSKKLQAGK